MLLEEGEKKVFAFNILLQLKEKSLKSWICGHVVPITRIDDSFPAFLCSLKHGGSPTHFLIGF